MLYRYTPLKHWITRPTGDFLTRLFFITRAICGMIIWSSKWLWSIPACGRRPDPVACPSQSDLSRLLLWSNITPTVGASKWGKSNDKQGFLDASSEVSGIFFFGVYRIHRGRNKKRSVIKARRVRWPPLVFGGLRVWQAIPDWKSSAWWLPTSPEWLGKETIIGLVREYLQKTPIFNGKNHGFGSRFPLNQSNAKRVEITNQSLASYFKQSWDNWCSSPRTSLYPAWFGIIQYSKIF